MSISSEITRISVCVESAYDAVEAKGGTMPASQTVGNLASAIGTIPSGVATAERHNVTKTGSNLVVTTDITNVVGYAVSSLSWGQNRTLEAFQFDTIYFGNYASGSNSRFSFDNKSLSDHLTQSGNTVTITPYSSSYPWVSGVTYAVVLFG